MTGLPRRYWHEMTTKDFTRLDAERAIAVLPVGAIEQHGPHLPVWVDTCLNQGILARAVELMPQDLPVTILPTIPVGKSDEHQAFPGTLTLHPETLLHVLIELGESVWRAGIRKLVLFNSHGGQPQILDIASQELRGRLEMFVVAVSWFQLGLPDGLFSEAEVRHGIHAGGIETSMMLHLAPHLVQDDERRDFTPLSVEMDDQFKYLSPGGAIGFAWQSQDLNAYGACGNAGDADAGRGRAVVDHAARCLVELLQEVDRFPLDAIRSRV